MRKFQSRVLNCLVIFHIVRRNESIEADWSCDLRVSIYIQPHHGFCSISDIFLFICASALNMYGCMHLYYICKALFGAHTENESALIYAGKYIG